MFLENFSHSVERHGSIEVITGSMFSGKTEELMRRLRRAVLAKQKVMVFKPLVDTRYAAESVVSHDRNRLACIPVAAASGIPSLADGAEVVGIDEAQFFSPDIVDVCLSLANSGVRVVLAGLDMDFRGEPFGSMPTLMSLAEHVTKVHPICSRCGGLAQFSHRTSADDGLVLLGETESYEPLCRSCFRKTQSQKTVFERATGVSTLNL